MKFNLLCFLQLITHIQLIHSYNLDGISQIVCHFSKFKTLDIAQNKSMKRSTQIEFSKRLMKKCKIKSRFIKPSTTENYENFIIFSKDGIIDNIPDGQGLIFLEHSDFSQIQPTKINQDVKFIQLDTWRIYEHYVINGQVINQEIGYFDVEFKYIPTMEENLLKRRHTFQGYHMTVMTEKYFPFSYFDLESASYDDKSQTYDVTNIAQAQCTELIINEILKIFNKTFAG